MIHTGRRKVLIGILLFLSVLCLCIAASAEIVDSGICGDDLNWTLDSEGLLTISGTGDMYEYGSCGPWGYEITDIVFNQGITSIGSYAFDNCTRLSGISVPGSVTRIGQGAFVGCSSVTGITIAKGVTDIGDYAFAGCGITGITIPDSVTRIGSDAFSFCSLIHITIPDSVTSLGSGVFNNCTDLSGIDLPNGLTSIPYYSFCNCTSLTSITLPGKVTSIDINAFLLCGNLKSISFPESLGFIEEYAFDGCVNLKNVYHAGAEKARDGISIKYGNDFLVNAKWHFAKTIAKSGVYKLNDKKTEAVFIGPERKDIKSLVIQDTVRIDGRKYKVTEVAAGACKGMSKLTTLTIGKNVKTIGKEAFYKCKKAKTIKIRGTALKAIGQNAFGGGYSKPTVYCAKKKIKAYTKLLQKAGLSKKAVFKELK